MKTIKLISVAIICLFISQVTLAAETHFDLHEQNFSEAIKEGEMLSARYELLKSYVTTNLKHTSTYYTLNENGFFKVELKSPLATWGVSFDMGYKFYYTNRPRSIIFTAENGTALTISSSRWHSTSSNGGMFFNGEIIYSPSYYERLSITMNKDNTDTVTLNINGREAASVSKSNFDKLKFVEVQLIHENGYNDAMHNLIIAGE